MDLDTLKIDLKGLKEGLNSFEFDLDDAYFKAVNAPEVSCGSVHVSLDIVRTESDYFTLDFHEEGTVIVPCDLCLEDMEQPFETSQRLEAKFGIEYSEEDDLVSQAKCIERLVFTLGYIQSCSIPFASCANLCPPLQRFQGILSYQRTSLSFCEPRLILSLKLVLDAR